MTTMTYALMHWRPTRPFSLTLRSPTRVAFFELSQVKPKK